MQNSFNVFQSEQPTPRSLLGDSGGARTLSLFGPTYDVIYADPPWQYGSGGARGARYGALDYPTMSTAEICALPVSLIAADDAALFLWFTGSFLMEAPAVATAWGFVPVRIDKVWVKKKTMQWSSFGPGAKLRNSAKPHGVVGPWGMSDSEFLLLAVRGSMFGNQADTGQYTVVEAPYPGRHSAKPEIFRQQIEARFPNARRLELFARAAAPQWDLWGNEVTSSEQVRSLLGEVA